jgi:ABC-type multidrug transport system fused ATPase/permease subunit
MIILVLFLIYENNHFNEVVPLIALYAFVGYRLIPATQTIFSSLSMIRFSGSALNNLHKDLANLKQLNKTKIPLDRTISLSHSINLKDITYNYPTSTKQILKNINIQIPALNIVGIVGSTGSGKTTLVDLILGLLELNKGIIRIDGEIINKQNIKLWQKHIGYVPQNVFLSDLSILENVAFGKDFASIDLEAVKNACKVANIHDFIENELSNGYKTLVGERGVRLSGGQKQRIGIARALYKKPSILILDEATSALDTLTEKKVMNAIQTLRDKITIIIIAHRLSTLKKCNKIFLLEKGEINAQGTYEELIKSNKFFSNMASS